MTSHRAPKLALLAALATAALALLWGGLQLGGPAEAAGDGVASSSAAPVVLTAQPGLERAEGGGSTRRETVVEPAGVRAGVRLSGNGRLEGRVVTLAGEGVSEARVELMAFPPSFGALIDRSLDLA
ncbi:MAG: hypothetical protein AAFZ65_08920, partial [Planctomycetota bacterium]